MRGFLLVVLAVGLAGPAAAQERSASADAAARRLFQQGVAAAQEERWDEAHDAFERAYAVSQRLSILLNLAGAQAETGRLVEAGQSYRHFLAESTRGREARYRSTAEEALVELDERTPTMVVVIASLAPDDEVVLDGLGVSHEVLGLELPVNPGTRTIQVRRDDELVVDHAIDIEEGARREVRLSTAPATDVAPDVLVHDEDEDEATSAGSIFASPWLWTGVGAVVVGAIVVVVATSSGGEADPFVGNFDTGMVTFE